MRIHTLLLLSLVGLGLAACAPGGVACPSGDGGRAAIGAVGGAVLADLLDENALTGAALGAGAGALADDVGICR